MKTRLQQTAKDVAPQVLSEVDAVGVWKKLIHEKNPHVVARTMEYLTDRVYGRPAQTIQGNQQPMTIQLQWSSTPEWLPVTVTRVNDMTSTDRPEEIRRLIGGQPRRLK